MLKHNGSAPNDTPHASTSAATPIDECCSKGSNTSANINSEIMAPTDTFRLRVTVDDTTKFEMNPMMPNPSSSQVIVAISRFALCSRNGVTYVYEQKCAPKTSA